MFSVYKVNKKQVIDKIDAGLHVFVCIPADIIF